MKKIIVTLNSSKLNLNDSITTKLVYDNSNKTSVITITNSSKDLLKRVVIFVNGRETNSVDNIAAFSEIILTSVNLNTLKDIKVIVEHLQGTTSMEFSNNYIQAAKRKIKNSCIDNNSRIYKV